MSDIVERLRSYKHAAEENARMDKAWEASFLLCAEIMRHATVEVERQRAEVARLESLVYVPGLWKCAKCGCAVVSSTLSAATGQLKADDKPQDCPNGCGPMWRRTEREAGNELADRLDASADEANRLRAELARVEAACGEMRAALKRIVNGPWERFTVNTVEARTAQQVLLQILDVANTVLASPAGQRTLAVIERDERQRLVVEWGIAAFGLEQMTSLAQRGVRLLEEAIEAYQAAGADPAMAHKLVDYVFRRPVGDLAKELGGVGVTTLALANAAGVSADQAERTEVERVLAKGAAFFTLRNQAKNDAGFDALAALKEPEKNKTTPST